MWILKKIISRLFFPVPVCVEILLVGLFLLWFTRRQRAGKIAVSIGAAFLLLLGNRNLSGHLLAPLEHRYPPPAVSETDHELSSARFVVVLAGRHTNDPQIPLDSRLGEDTLARMAKAIQLHRRLLGRKLILSGGGWMNAIPAAEHMARFAEDLGVNREDILLESKSQDTEDEARLIRPMVGGEPFILVTSASHVPRSMALFQNMGMNPIAAPTDYLARQSWSLEVDELYPGSEGLGFAERAVYEYLGIAWAKLRGKI